MSTSFIRLWSQFKNGFLVGRRRRFMLLLCLLGLLSVLQVTYWQYRSIDNESDDTLQAINIEEHRGNEHHDKLKNTKIKSDKEINVKLNTLNVLNKEDSQNIMKSLNTDNKLVPTEKKEVHIVKKEVLIEKKPEEEIAITPVMNTINGLLTSDEFVQQGIKLKWIGQRIKRSSSSWEESRNKLVLRQKHLFTDPKHILIFPGLLTKEYSSYDYANMAFRGGFLGELTQWSDLIATLHMLGHKMTFATSLQQLIDAGAKKDVHYHVVFTDYHGMNGMHQSKLMGTFKCRIRLLDSFGTEAKYNFRTTTYMADKNGADFSNWSFEDLRQFWTLYPHTPDNSFLGFVMEQLKDAPPHSKRKNQAVIYGKEGWYIRGYEHYLDVIGQHVEVHGTLKNPIPSTPKHIVNHGLQTPANLLKLLQESRIFIGLGFPYEGPGPMEAMANGCVFIQPRFKTPHNRFNTKFFSGKPTDREYKTQTPYLEHHVGEPYVYTVNITDDKLLTETIKSALKYANFSSHVPYEFTQEGMMERVGIYILYQDFCRKNNVAINKPVTSSSAESPPEGAVDGLDTPDTCFKSEMTNKQQVWRIDLGVNTDIDTIKITIGFDWIFSSSRGFTSVPFQVSVITSDGVVAISKECNDQRLFYLWENLQTKGRYVEVRTVKQDTKNSLVLCSVGIYPPDTSRLVWSSSSLSQTVVSQPGHNCRDTCMDEGMICEPDYFPIINNEETLQLFFNCKKTRVSEYSYLPFLPAYALKHSSQHNVVMGDCLINGNKLLLSCAGKHENYKRVCPCRQYIKGQITVPENQLQRGIIRKDLIHQFS